MSREIKQEDLYLITEHLVRYAPAKPSIAIPRLLNIEVIRNTYTKSTLYNVFNGVRHTLKTGRKHKHISLAMFDIIMDNFYKESMGVNPEPTETVEAKPVELKPEEIVSQLKLSLQVIEEAIEKDLRALEIQEEMIKEKRDEIRAARDRIVADTHQSISYWTTEMYKQKWLA